VLGRYYITTRYPNGVPSGIPADHFDERDAQEAIAFAQRIEDLVRTKWTALKKAEAKETDENSAQSPSL
jgi:HEPN domain-containing protein